MDKEKLFDATEVVSPYHKAINLYNTQNRVQFLINHSLHQQQIIYVYMNKPISQPSSRNTPPAYNSNTEQPNCEETKNGKKNVTTSHPSIGDSVSTTVKI